MTVVFPDSTLPEPTRGGFASQEEFRHFVLKHQDGRWDSQYHSRPSSEIVADYQGDTIAQAFPVLFPYGFSGLPEDPAVVKASEGKGKKKHLKRNRLSVLKHYLRHRRSGFHGAMFNLIVQNCLMKETIFTTARIRANMKCSDGSSMGEKYGKIKAKELENAILASRLKVPYAHSSKPAPQYLKTIHAACSNLPHSNEASQDARKIYFSYLIKFGLPCIFFTISPDDSRNYRIVVYSLQHKEYEFGKIDVNSFSDEEIMMEFNIRHNIRVGCPGLCAEEYQRIIQLVIKHIFQWDLEGEKSTGVGIFSELLAWCLATEEQGRKSLHGHFLLFVKHWKQLLNILQRMRLANRKHMEHPTAVRHALAFYRSSCSANLFQDFAPPLGVLKDHPVFHHKECDIARLQKKLRFSVKPVSNQFLREMRHRQKCVEHNGRIASCGKCQKEFRVQQIVANALNHHLGKDSGKSMAFPDTEKRLDQHVYEMHKNSGWMEGGAYEEAVHYFASNALVNVHLVTHANRCFKSGKECYASLPDGVVEKANIVFNEEADEWSDHLGHKEPRYMFRFYPKRPIEDAFMNTHSPSITKLLGCNSNVMIGMNGSAVFYVTGYNAKSTQKEESEAYEKISQVLVKCLQKREEVSPSMICVVF